MVALSGVLRDGVHLGEKGKVAVDGFIRSPLVEGNVRAGLGSSELCEFVFPAERRARRRSVRSESAAVTLSWWTGALRDRAYDERGSPLRASWPVWRLEACFSSPVHSTSTVTTHRMMARRQRPARRRP